MEYNYKVDDFMEFLYEENSHAGEVLLTTDKKDFERLRENKREDLRKCLGIDKLEAYACIEKPILLETEEHENYKVEQFGMKIASKLVMPFYVLTPHKPLLTKRNSPKGVIYSHGHGDGGVRDCLIVKDPREYHKNIPLTLVERGYTVYMPEPVAFGDFNITRSNYIKGDISCFPITTQLLLHGITTVGLRVFQIKCIADLMEKQGIEDYAISGISGGSTVASMYAAIDDRLKATALSGFVNMYKSSIMGMYHCVDNFIPNILSVGESPYIVAMGVPKPIYISSGTCDKIFPLEGTKKAIRIIQEIYKNQTDISLVAYEIFEGGHEFSEKFIDWLDEIL